MERRSTRRPRRVRAAEDGGLSGIPRQTASALGVSTLPSMDHGLVLASRSPRRRELLSLLALPFETTSVDLDETPLPGEKPAELVQRLARAKAQTASAQRANDLVLAADTIVTFGPQGPLLGKPRDAAEAAEMLHQLRERPHRVHSAIALLDSSNGNMLTDVCSASVWMRAYTDEEIATYVASGDPLDKAGAYAIQHTGFDPVGRLEGCFACVVGLPLCHLTRALAALDIHLAISTPAVCQSYLDHQCPVYPEILAGIADQVEQL